MNNTTNPTTGYSKEESKFVAGMAILLMFYHHLIGFPCFWPYDNCIRSLGIYVCGIPTEKILSTFGKICVGIFAFNTGYILTGIVPAELSKPHGQRNIRAFRPILFRLFRFLAGYWIVCLLFLLYGFMTGYPLPDTKNLICNLFGYNTGVGLDFINVHHGWYVLYYVILLLIAPMIVRISRLTDRWYLDCAAYALLLLAIPLMPYGFLEYMCPLSATFAGVIVYKYDVLRRCKESFLFTRSKIIRAGIAFLILTTTILVRFFYWHLNEWERLDGIFAFATILSFLMIYSCIGNKARKLIIGIGILSMYLWFLHSIFVFDPTMSRLLYSARYPILIVLWGVALMTPPAMLVASAHRHLFSLFRRKPSRDASPASREE